MGSIARRDCRKKNTFQGYNQGGLHNIVMREDKLYLYGVGVPFDYRVPWIIDEKIKSLVMYADNGFSLDHKITFGKYKSRRLKAVIKYNPQYILWATGEIRWFKLNLPALKFYFICDYKTKMLSAGDISSEQVEGGGFFGK